MNIKEYEQEMKRTIQYIELNGKNLCLAGLGISGEAGEVSDYIKKVIYHDHELNKEILASELGDVLWYLTYTSHLLGYNLEEIATINAEKLKKRYPNGWEPDRNMKESIE